MSKYTRRTFVPVPRNGTSTLTATFPAPAAGALLVVIGVPGGATFTAGPAGFTAPPNGAIVGNTGLYVWWKIANGTETSVSATMNGPNRPGGFEIYEFPPGSTFGTVASAGGIHYNGPTGIPGKTGIVSPKTIISVIADSEPSGEVSITTTFISTTGDDATLIKELDHADPFNVTEGYAMASSILDDKTGDYGVNFTSNGGSEDKTAMTFDVTPAVVALAVNAGADQSIIDGMVASLSATISGGSGARVIAWSITSGGTGTFGTGAAASTTFTPTSGAGTYVLRCTVTDSSGSSFDEVQVAVGARTSSARVYSVNSATGWSAFGGAADVKAALSDSLDTTGMVTSDTPTNVVLDTNLSPMNAPAAGDSILVTLRGHIEGSTSGSIVVKLYEGATLRSTQTVAFASIPTADGNMVLTIPAADIAAVAPSAWTSGGMRLTITATAA